ncbi:hypothetical protein BJX66DRAFT_339731 [Aspergillus keveii]|uniref:Transmembrane protein n=1 Tax=Aspergillus keveii TaxID=714993 RepID=A0ABR4G0L8_9EURO
MATCTEDNADSDACEKPTSEMLLYGVPAIISAILLVAFVIACYIFVRRYQRRERAEDERMDEHERMEELRAFKKVDEEGSWAERREYGLPPAYSGPPAGSTKGRRGDEF